MIAAGAAVAAVALPATIGNLAHARSDTADAAYWRGRTDGLNEARTLYARLCTP